jgi:hypothetical protein
MQAIYSDVQHQSKAPPVNISQELRMPFNVKRKSVTFTPIINEPNRLSLTFETDTLEDCFVVIHTVCMDVLDSTGNTMYLYSD